MLEERSPPEKWACRIRYKASLFLPFRPRDSGVQKHYRRTAEGFKTDSLDDYYAKTSNCARSNIPVQIKPSRSYWEGGNVITASNSAGEIKVLVGADSATITHQALRNSGFFRPVGEQNTHYINETLNNEFKDSIRELYVKGKIPSKVKELAPKLSEEETFAVAHEMQAVGLLPVIKKEEKEKLTDIVTDYLGQREFVKRVLWPAEFEVDAKNIVEIPQAAYHLDAFLKPGPRGSFFVQDFEKSEEFLRSLLGKNRSYPKRSNHCRELSRRCGPPQKRSQADLRSGPHTSAGSGIYAHPDTGKFLRKRGREASRSQLPQCRIGLVSRKAKLLLYLLGSKGGR